MREETTALDCYLDDLCDMSEVITQQALEIQQLQQEVTQLQAQLHDALRTVMRRALENDGEVEEYGKD